MKDSSIEWIGEIPEGWKIVRIKNVIEKSKDGIKVGPFGSALSGRMQSNADFNVYSQANLVANDFSSTKNTIYSADFEILKNYEVKSGDVCISMMGTVGKCKTVPEGINRGIMDSHLIKVRLNSSVINNRFFEYVYDKDLGAVCFEQIKLDKKGTIMDGLNTTVVKTLFLPLPSFSEQTAIADYLDKKCAAIDTVIEKEQQVIEKLTEYKQSVITEAVTKGLNPDVPMKDSGIEWIGEIPEKWRMIRLKFLMKEIIDCPHETPIYSSDGEYFVIRTSDQGLGKLKPDKQMYRLSADEYKKRIRRLSVNKGDIVYGREGSWGLACLIQENNKYCLGQRMMQFRTNPKYLLPEFTVWALNSKNIYLQGAVDSLGSTAPHVNISTVINYNLPIPSASKQTAIADYLDKKCASIDNLIAKKQQLIDKLTEYKKSLIYEMVTGKKEVPLC